MAEYAVGGTVQVCIMRLAVLDGEGVPNPGTSQLFVTDGLAKIDFTPVNTKGVDLELLNGCGAPVVVYKDMDRFKRFDCTMTINYLDPELEIMLIGGESYTSGGYTIGSSVPNTAAYAGYYWGVSMELWSKHIVAGDIDPIYPWVRWVIPRTRWMFDKMTFDNAAVTREFTGYTSQNPNFYNGPANDWPYPSDTQLMYAYAKTAPTAVVGAQTLVHS